MSATANGCVMNATANGCVIIGNAVDMSMYSYFNGNVRWNSYENTLIISHPLKILLEDYEGNKTDIFKELDTLKETVKNLEKRLTAMEFSPPAQGGTEFQKILNEEISDGLLG